MSEPDNNESKTGVDVVYQLLESNSIDSLLALKGALRYFAASEGRDLVDVAIETISFRQDNDGDIHLGVRARLVP